MSVICDAGIITKFAHFNDITHIAFVIFICDALYRLWNLKNVKNFHGGVLLSAKLLAEIPYDILG